MTVLRSQTKIVISLAAMVILVLVVWLVASTLLRNNSYSLLEKAVAEQTFADKLGVPERSSKECYPGGKSSTCLALRYAFSAEECQKITTSLNRSNQKRDRCSFTKAVRNYQGTEITYTLSAEDNTLTASVGDN